MYLPGPAGPQPRAKMRSLAQANSPMKDDASTAACGRLDRKAMGDMLPTAGPGGLLATTAAAPSVGGGPGGGRAPAQVRLLQSCSTNSSSSLAARAFGPIAQPGA